MLWFQAKDVLFRKIDTYIRERIIIADQVIQETAGNKIKDGDVILTYARYFFLPVFTRFHRSWMEQVICCGESSSRGAFLGPELFGHRRRFKTYVRGCVTSPRQPGAFD